MSDKRPTKKAPAEAGAGHPHNFSDPEVLASHFSRLYFDMPENWSNPGAGSLDGVYRHQRELALKHLEPVAETVEEILHGEMLEAERKAMRYALSPSQQAALILLEAMDRLLAMGPPADEHARRLVAYAQRAAIHAQVGIGQRVVRDEGRQAGTRKERRPEITEWIGKQLARNPAATRMDLWETAPEWITDQIGLDRFGKRVRAARKELAASK